MGQLFILTAFHVASAADLGLAQSSSSLMIMMCVCVCDDGYVDGYAADDDNSEDDDHVPDN